MANKSKNYNKFKRRTYKGKNMYLELYCKDFTTIWAKKKYVGSINIYKVVKRKQ